MGLQHDDSTSRAPATRPRGWLRAAIVGTMAILFVGAAVGFIAFLSQLRGVEIKPARTADGIVVLTGGSSRISDAVECFSDVPDGWTYGIADHSHFAARTPHGQTLRSCL